MFAALAILADVRNLEVLRKNLGALYTLRGRGLLFIYYGFLICGTGWQLFVTITVLIIGFLFVIMSFVPNCNTCPEPLTGGDTSKI